MSKQKGGDGSVTLLRPDGTQYSGSKSTSRTNRGGRSVERDEQERRMRVWEGHTVLNLLRAGEDAGWVVAMIVIGFTSRFIHIRQGARLQSMSGLSFSSRDRQRDHLRS